MNLVILLNLAYLRWSTLSYPNLTPSYLHTYPSIRVSIPLEDHTVTPHKTLSNTSNKSQSGSHLSLLLGGQVKVVEFQNGGCIPTGTPAGILNRRVELTPLSDEKRRNHTRPNLLLKNYKKSITEILVKIENPKIASLKSTIPHKGIMG